ncbi:hypothetical protein FKP32DRAFT_1624257 [Trametes sanguinea]|nr:hypothetical protein FKP32DRAFT_1624257 [Trametes sanguinea]
MTIIIVAPSNRKIKRPPHFVYRFLGRFADIVDDAMRMLRIVPGERPMSDYTVTSSDMDQMSDEDLLHLLDTDFERHSLSEEARVELHDHNVSRWSDGTVLKATDQLNDDEVPEAIAMDLVFHHTLIPVPRVRRVIREGSDGFIWMDCIRGRQLKFVWPTLSILGKIRVAFVLRRYIRELRSVRHPRSAVPGPLGLAPGGRVHSSVMYGEIVPYRGPFSTYAELSAFWNERHRIAHMPQAGAPEDAARVLEPFDDSQPLVLTHGDLNLRNILVGEDGRLWLIDWGDAGFYPPWFEFVTTRLQQYQSLDPGDWVWELMIPFICDPYYKQELWYMHTRRGLNYR